MWDLWKFKSKGRPTFYLYCTDAFAMDLRQTVRYDSAFRLTGPGL